MNKMPVLFVGHGSPMNAIEDNRFSRKFKEVGEKLVRPKSILCISAHWETDGSKATAQKLPETIHDFYGFPDELYAASYPAPGDPELAKRVETITGGAVAPDTAWGLDHGTWSVLCHMFPKADIPVVQLSLDRDMSPEEHFQLGKTLSVLRGEGVLIIASGNIVHNLRRLNYGPGEVETFGWDWAEGVNEKVKRCIVEAEYQPLFSYQKQGDAFRQAIPTPEHYLPLLYILGAREEGEKAVFFNDSCVLGALSMTSVIFGAGE